MKAASRWIWLIFIFLATQGVYLHTLNPSFSNDDSAETITASVTLGLQHPPGYALAALLGRCQSLFPLGDFGFRANWGASCIGSLGAVLLVLLILNLGNQLPFLKAKHSWMIVASAVWGGLSLAFCPTYWQNALSAKGGIYLLSLCFQLLIFMNLMTMAEKKKEGAREKAGLVFFLMGLGLANHWETMIIFVPALFLFLSWTFPIKLKDWIKSFSFGALGLSALLYLPLRSHLNPVLDLGSPDRLSYFWDDLSRHYFAYREMTIGSALFDFFKHTMTGDQLSSGFHHIFKMKREALFLNLKGDLGGGSLALALVAIGFWIREKEKSLLIFMGLSGFLLWASLFSYGSFLPNLDMPFMMLKFFLSSDWMIFLWAALGLCFLLLRINDWEKRVGQGMLVLLLGALLWNVQNHWNRIDQQDQTLLYDYGQNLLKSLPPRSIFFAESDEDYFSLYYLQQVKHFRLDVTMIPTFILFEPWGVDQVEQKYADLGLTASTILFPDHFSRIIYATSEIVVKNRNHRPISFSNFNGAFHQYYLNRQKKMKVYSSGIVWLLAPSIDQKRSCLGLAGLRLRNLGSLTTPEEGSLEGLRKIYQSFGLF